VFAFKKNTKRRRLTISIWSEATKSNFLQQKNGGKKMAGKIWRQKNVVTCQKSLGNKAIGSAHDLNHNFIIKSIISSDLLLG
jgi:hypothetical protein